MHPARVLVIAGAVGACARSDDGGRCRELGDGTLRSLTVEVRRGSRLTGDGGLVAGEVGRCGDEATAHFMAATAALEAIPPVLRPARVVVHYAPTLPVSARPVLALEMHRPSGSLLAAGPGVPPAVWLHELAHVRMLGERPESPVPQRLFAAIEEAVADYFAGAVQGSPRVAERSLDRPPHLVGDDWATLALDSFDPHRPGWALASAFWAREPRAGALLEDLVDCVAHVRVPVETRASAAIAGWMDACSERSRAAIRATMCGWLPRELAPGC